MKYIFILDHHNYARWLSVHLKELLELEQTRPALFKEFFYHGRFVVKKTRRPHSSIAIDQVHVQMNEMLKNSTGGRDFLNRNDDLEALMRFIVSTPIAAGICSEYEDTFGPWPGNPNEHHECYSAFQKNFYNDVGNLYDFFNSSFNPYDSKSPKVLCFVNNGCPMPNS